jgi:hypothetical protein
VLVRNGTGTVARDKDSAASISPSVVRGRPDQPSTFRLSAVVGVLLVASNAVIRFGYGVAALTAPSNPVGGKVPLAPDTERFPEARLFVRGFASHQVGVGLMGLASLARRELRRPAMALAAVTDLADIASAVIEARARQRLDGDLGGGIAFSSVGLISALLAMNAADRPRR